MMEQEVWSDSSGSYLRLAGDAGERIGDRILRRRCVQGVLPVEFERVNDRQEYVYETTGFKTLNEYLESQPLKKGQWIVVWNRILELVEELEQYLMDGEHLLIDGEHLYLRGDRPEVGGVYLPSHKQKLSEAICSLLEKAIRYPEADRETAEYLYRIHDTTATRDLTRQELRALLCDEEKPEEKEQKKEEKNASAETGIRSRLRTGILNETSDSEKRSRLLAYGLLACGVLIPALLFRFGVFVSSVTGRVNYTMLIAAFLFFISVAAYGAKTVWPKRRTVPDYITYEDDLSVCLIPQVTGLRVLPVMGFPWSIGRDEVLADGVVDREDVAPVHARIRRESQSVYLIDEETSAGTFLNNKRLTPWEKNRVHDGDTVSFGTSPFVVEITGDFSAPTEPRRTPSPAS